MEITKEHILKNLSAIVDKGGFIKSDDTSLDSLKSVSELLQTVDFLYGRDVFYQVVINAFKENE